MASLVSGEEVEEVVAVAERYGTEQAEQQAGYRLVALLPHA